MVLLLEIKATLLKLAMEKYTHERICRAGVGGPKTSIISLFELKNRREPIIPATSTFTM